MLADAFLADALQVIGTSKDDPSMLKYGILTQDKVLCQLRSKLSKFVDKPSEVQNDNLELLSMTAHEGGVNVVGVVLMSQSGIGVEID
jgi:hypothetical protein